MMEPRTIGTEMATGAARPSRFRSSEERWAAVRDRDAGAEGAFFYSVATTGVYCRPGCPSRRPRREHVRFHLSCREAERAGFRACRRCRPDEPPLAERRAEAVAAACRLIETAEEPPALEALAAAAGMSGSHFHRVFKAATGCTPRAYAAARRAHRMRDALQRGGGTGTVTDAVYDAGFGSNARFYAASPDILGMAPTAFRRGGAGETIRFAVGACSLGAVLVAATAKGVCAITLGDEPDTLVRDLEDRFPRAELVGGDPEFEDRVARVVGLVEAPARGLDLPLDIRGTAFEQRVWQALREVPPGATATYREIAERIGAPGAARAVGRACASNPLAVAVPCHRVVRKDGAPGGYRWGVERKRALLDREVSP